MNPRTVCSTRYGIRFSTGRTDLLGRVGLYPTNFDIVEEDFAVTTGEVSFDGQLDVFFIPVDHRHCHLGTTPGPFDTDGQQKV